MKKIFYILITLIIIITLVLIIKPKENNENITTIKVAEVTHSAFYTPFYVAIKNNYFKDNNINIDLILTSGANNVIAAVLSKDVDIGLCGPPTFEVVKHKLSSKPRLYLGFFCQEICILMLYTFVYHGIILLEK